MRGFHFLRLFLLIMCGPPFAATAQSGCTDPQALNYTLDATVNDGSCVYPITNYAPLLKATWPDHLREISGLHFAGGRWWGHNDGGNPNYFYRLLPETGATPQQIELQTASNQDWEDITSDSTHLYIGDFGNNLNDRQNLGIYQVPFSAIGTFQAEVVAENDWTFLPFSYADQTDFSPQPADSTEYDCEAMIFLHGSLHLFTKDHKHQTTTHYRLNPVTGQAEPLETFDTHGLITGASLSPDGKLVALLGYELIGIPKIFCWLLWDWHDGLLFNGNKRRLELGNVFTLGQAEAIGFGTNRAGYIANERVTVNGIPIVESRSYTFDFGPWVPELVATQTPDNLETRLFPNPFTQVVRLPAFVEYQPGSLRVTNAQGKVMLQTSSRPSILDASTWPSGWYAFAWTGPARTIVMRGLKQ